MNIIPKWVDGISIYCEWLYEVNKLVIKLTGLDCINNGNEIKKMFLDISHIIVKLVPCEVDYKKQKVKLSKRDGIFNFASELMFLEKDYDNLFSKYSESLYKIKTIRNKSEHEPHNLKMPFLSSGSTSHPNVTFEYDGINYGLKTEEFIEIVIELNSTFNKIINELKEFKYKNNKEYGDHPYLVKYSSLDYEMFNRILNSSSLSDIGKAMREF